MTNFLGRGGGVRHDIFFSRVRDGKSGLCPGTGLFLRGLLPDVKKAMCYSLLLELPFTSTTFDLLKPERSITYPAFHSNLTGAQQLGGGSAPSGRDSRPRGCGGLGGRAARLGGFLNLKSKLHLDFTNVPHAVH